jgi:hypothetical protein
MINTGVIEMTSNGSVAVRIYYDATFSPAGDDQPLINGPRGFCLDVTNTSGKNAHLVISGLSAAPIDVTVGQGDPVTSGPGRSRTVAVMNNAGFATRGSLGNMQIG